MATLMPANKLPVRLSTNGIALFLLSKDVNWPSYLVVNLCSLNKYRTKLFNVNGSRDVLIHVCSLNEHWRILLDAHSHGLHTLRNVSLNYLCVTLEHALLCFVVILR